MFGSYTMSPGLGSLTGVRSRWCGATAAGVVVRDAVCFPESRSPGPCARCRPSCTHEGWA